MTIAVFPTSSFTARILLSLRLIWSRKRLPCIYKYILIDTCYIVIPDVIRSASFIFLVSSNYRNWKILKMQQYILSCLWRLIVRNPAVVVLFRCLLDDFDCIIKCKLRRLVQVSVMLGFSFALIKSLEIGFLTIYFLNNLLKYFLHNFSIPAHPILERMVYYV